MHTFKVLSFVLVCVKVKCEMTSFIVGGHSASIHEFPHSVYLKIASIKPNGGLSHYVCGGSIVNQKVILTAAHCLENSDHIYAIVGSANRLKGISKRARSTLTHKYYDAESCDRDIGLVGLSSPLIFNSNVRRVVLMKNPPYEEMAFVAGWGLTNDYSESTPIMLKYVDQIVQNWNHCSPKRHGSLTGKICAKSLNPKYYPNVGDSGSALVVRGFIQIGLVSYKIPGIPVNIITYTDVGYFYDWITKYSQRIFCI